ncbi:hypothetical protein H5410_038897 [Solanum commersonii]|uniref:F-box domain-containing protein n=1 Tax=Solanum commersonii TaxID=4109 RepID=A0A9J5YBF0_SOLCO|nr:hypothetical protein H5410_038897 [Solanum commersonii]
MDIDWAIEIYFPEEIIVEILIRLPVHSLLRFKCASKFWKTLITSDHFKAKHYNYAKNNKKILITRWHPDHTTSYYCSSLSSPQPLQKLGCCPSNNKPNRYEVLCCCDGLSLLHFFYDYLLWNPSTNESIQLPYIDYQESIRSTFGLGYDSISDGYKILKIDNSGDDSRPPSKILALKSGSWRKIDNHPRIFHNSTYRDGPLTFVCGAFYWLSKDNVNNYFMVSLDISSEVYKEIPLPEGICNIPNMAFIKRDVSVIEGMLCAYCSCLHARAAGDTFKLWVMKDYGIKESWTILFNIQDRYIYYIIGIPKYIFGNDQILLIYNCGVCRGYRTSTGLSELFPAHHGTQRGLATEIYFPEKIIVEILIRLPVQSLLQFKCASKFWKTLITSEHFKGKHYNHAKNNKKILITRWFLDHTASYYCSSLSSAQPLQKLGSCPSNNKPNSTFGFGYDSISDDYKILKIDNIGGDDSRPPSKILALKSGSWRKIDNHPRIFHNSTYREDPLAFVCGAFHWLSNDNVNKYFMISLNISSEVYREIQLPEGICNIPNMRFIKRDVSVIEGMLCAYCSCLHAGSDTFKLW